MARAASARCISRGALSRGKGWTESAARREIAGILEVLGKLHRGQALHHDLTPLNVFVCDGHRLKLGDFGIVRQQSDRRPLQAARRDAGIKLMEIKRLREKGQRITLLNEPQFWRLAGGARAL